MRRGIMFNIIDTTAGVKADLAPLTYDPNYETAFARRIRQTFKDTTGEQFEAWCAQPTDIIIGKLRAWAEGRSNKHPSDIYEMLVFWLSDLQTLDIELTDIEEIVTQLGDETLTLWHDLFMRASIDAQKLRKAEG